MAKSENLARLKIKLIERIQTRVAKALSFVQRKYQQIFANSFKGSSRQRYVCLFLAGIIFSVAIAACSGSSSAKKSDVKLKLVSYSVTKAAHDRIIPKFVEKWKKQHNQNVIFEQSYGGSGAQALAVISGSQQADIVHLALPLDITKIQQAGLIKPGWESKAPRNGVVTRSVATIVTREGNPKGIKTWEDLAKDNVKMILANPKTSGIGIWEVLALWGSVTQTQGEETAALKFLTKVYQNAVILAKDAREASDLFFQKGQGDALINYENEIRLAQQKGSKLPYVIPQVNISIDNAVAVVDKYVDRHGTREVAEAFVDFLYSTEAQREFALLGYRPVNPTVSQEVAKQFPAIKTLFTAIDLGGWEQIQKKFFGEGGIFEKVQAAKKA